MENAGIPFTPLAPPPIAMESAEADEEAEVDTEKENAVYKAIDEEINAANNAEGEPVEAA